jgi:uroporphyrinogen-III synthase
VTTLLLVRPEAQSRQLAATLRARGATAPVVVSPVIGIAARQVALPRDADLVLTSQNAVAALPEGRWRAWCVGDRTAAAAAAHGLETRSAAGDVDALLQLLTEARPARLVHVRGAHAAGALAERLMAAGLAADEVVAYDQVPLPLTAAAATLLGGAGHVVLPLYSPRSAGLVAAYPGPWRARIDAVAISDAAARAFARPARITVSERPDGAAMEDAILAALAGASPLVDRDGAG